MHEIRFFVKEDTQVLVDVLEHGSVQRRVGGKLADHHVVAEQRADDLENGLVFKDALVVEGRLESQGNIMPHRPPVGAPVDFRLMRLQDRSKGLIACVD